MVQTRKGTSDGSNKRSSGKQSQQGPTESLQRFATNFLAQVKALEDTSGPLVPVKDVVRMVQRTRVVGEGDDAETETYNTVVLANEDVIKKARDQFMACIFLAGVDRDRYKDAIDEMNNDFLRHGKEYPSDVSSMVTWLLKRRGNTRVEPPSKFSFVPSNFT